MSALLYAILVDRLLRLFWPVSRLWLASPALPPGSNGGGLASARPGSRYVPGTSPRKDDRS